METKLRIKLLNILSILLLTASCCCQANSKKNESVEFNLKNELLQNNIVFKNDTISITQINIDGFKYENGIEKYKHFFGEPSKVDSYSYEEGDGPDGYEKTFYISYDNLNITYSIVYGNIVLQDIQVSGLPYHINIGGGSFVVGNSLNKLKEFFPKSFKYYQERYPKPYKQKEQRFYIYMVMQFPDYTHYGLINITLENEIITSFAFSFEEGA